MRADSELKVLTVPSESELQSGSAGIERVRGIEPDDLLGREPVQLDTASIAEMLLGRTTSRPAFVARSAMCLFLQRACARPSLTVAAASQAHWRPSRQLQIDRIAACATTAAGTETAAWNAVTLAEAGGAASCRSWLRRNGVDVLR